MRDEAFNYIIDTQIEGIVKLQSRKYKQINHTRIKLVNISNLEIKSWNICSVVELV